MPGPICEVSFTLHIMPAVMAAMTGLWIVVHWAPGTLHE